MLVLGQDSRPMFCTLRHIVAWTERILGAYVAGVFGWTDKLRPQRFLDARYRGISVAPGQDGLQLQDWTFALKETPQLRDLEELQILFFCLRRSTRPNLRLCGESNTLGQECFCLTKQLIPHLLHR